MTPLTRTDQPRLDPNVALKSRYRYVRVNIKGVDELDQPVEVIVGVELTPDLSLHRMYTSIRGAFNRSAAFHATMLTEDDAALAEIAEQIILEHWPERSYFIEVGRGENDEWVQVFTP